VYTTPKRQNRLQRIFRRASIKKQFLLKYKIMNDDYLNYGNPAYENDEEFECTECGTPVDKEFSVCSGTCFEASML